MKAVTLKVAGMSCGHCVRAVEDALKGVSGAKVDGGGVQMGQATVQIEDSVAVGALIDAISDAGYEAEVV